MSHVLDVLAGRAQSIVVEKAGEAGRGVEFIVVDNSGRERSHQVKRQRGNANSWSLRNLQKQDVLASAAAQVEAGREFVFVSLVPCRVLDELADMARRSDDFQSFIDGLTKELRQPHFDYLASEWGSAEKAYEILRSVYVSWPDERHVTNTNAALAGLLVAGAPGPASAVVLGDLVSDNLGKTLDAQAIEALLADYELSRANLITGETTDAVTGTFEAWTKRISAKLLAPEIPRGEATDLVERLKGDSRTVLVAGAAGAGKSGVLYQAVTDIAADWPVLAISLDQIEAFSSTHELGVDRLGLPASPVASLAAAAHGGDSLLVIDQLDAVSLASGRMSSTYEHVGALLDEAAAFSGMRVILACRQFDIDNDHRLRALAGQDNVEQMTVGPLDNEQVSAAVTEMGLDPGVLSETQRDLLRSPLNLVLLAAIADEADALSFQTAKGLMDAFYDRKRRDCRARRDPPPRFGKTIGVLAEDMSAKQRLFSFEAVLDAEELLDDADVLASENVLVRQDRRISFFHEAFFDYAFARGWLAREETLVAFLLAGEQELFRRAQVRQVLVHLHAEDPDRFVAEVEELLADPGVRFHIVEVVLALLRAIEAPSHAEWELVERRINESPAFVERLWNMLRTPGWFARADEEGRLEQWLAGDDEDLRNRALDIMLGSVKEHSARVAELLAGVRDRPFYANALRGLAFYTDLHESREMLDLVIDAIGQGIYDDDAHHLFMSAHALGNDEPRWAVELLKAWFVDRPGALDLTDDGKIAALDTRDHDSQEIIAGAAANAPGEFCGAMIPFLLEAMAATSEGNERVPKRDRHFGYRTFNGGRHDVDEALLYGARDALRALAAADDDRLDGLLDMLAADEHDAAQWLLYEALAAAGETRAEQAYVLLTEGDHRLFCGYSDGRNWTTRELIKAISPHLSDEQVLALEQVFMALRPEWERPPGGYSAFSLLSALPHERLSDAGRRRLGEWQRLFDTDEPPAPTGITAGFVRSPIPDESAERMTDDQWLRAIAKHNSDETNYSNLTGGADELASVLTQRTIADPARFVALGMRFDSETHPAYVNAIFHGLRVASDIAPAAVFDYMRHVVSLGRPDHDRWLPEGLHGRLAEDVPEDIIELLLDRARRANDPEEEAWQRTGWSGDRVYGGNPLSHGMNSARGAAALIIGDLLVHDADGSRTALIEPHFQELASDPSPAVRSCVAHVLAAGLRHAEESAIKAFERLIDTRDDLFRADTVEQLIRYVGFRDAATVKPVIQRMMASQIEEVREGGGRLAAFAGLEFEMGELLDDALASEDPLIRKGAATICAQGLPVTADARAATAALDQLFDDPDDKVRDAAADVALALRNQPLEPNRALIDRLLESAAFPDALAQLLFTLEDSTERVDDLVLATTRRFIEVFGGQVSSIASRASADARHVGELLLRAYSQASDSVARAAALDLIDELLAQAAYDLAKLVGAAER